MDLILLNHNQVASIQSGRRNPGPRTRPVPKDLYKIEQTGHIEHAIPIVAHVDRNPSKRKSRKQRLHDPDPKGKNNQGDILDPIHSNRATWASSYIGIASRLSAYAPPKPRRKKHERSITAELPSKPLPPVDIPKQNGNHLATPNQLTLHPQPDLSHTGSSGIPVDGMNQATHYEHDTLLTVPNAHWWTSLVEGFRRRNSVLAKILRRKPASSATHDLAADAAHIHSEPTRVIPRGIQVIHVVPRRSDISSPLPVSSPTIFQGNETAPKKHEAWPLQRPKSWYKRGRSRIQKWVNSQNTGAQARSCSTPRSAQWEHRESAINKRQEQQVSMSRCRSSAEDHATEAHSSHAACSVNRSRIPQWPNSQDTETQARSCSTPRGVQWAHPESTTNQRLEPKCQGTKTQARSYSTPRGAHWAHWESTTHKRPERQALKLGYRNSAQERATTTEVQRSNAICNVNRPNIDVDRSDSPWPLAQLPTVNEREFSRTRFTGSASCLTKSLSPDTSREASLYKEKNIPRVKGPLNLVLTDSESDPPRKTSSLDDGASETAASEWTEVNFEQIAGEWDSKGRTKRAGICLPLGKARGLLGFRRYLSASNLKHCSTGAALCEVLNKKVTGSRVTNTLRDFTPGASLDCIAPTSPVEWPPERSNASGESP
ncbi:hypothetical protein DXG01_016505 [Tephrocybe rancida]|nr:hypothetical protein DXG01_016505 [Tephrocybe rancida]